MTLVRADLIASFKVFETLGLGMDLAANPNINHVLEKDASLSPTSDPVATMVWSDHRALTAGADTIDLTALARPGLTPNMDMTGLKVQALMFRAKDTNANPIVFTKGGSNGYTVGGSAFSVSLSAGEAALLILDESAPDVDATHKTLAAAGTGTQEYDVAMVAG